VSTAIQEAMESVTTGDASAAKAASTYDSTLKDVTGGQVVLK
jgi:multiple sugar transport system substrate-binding protein